VQDSAASGVRVWSLRLLLLSEATGCLQCGCCARQTSCWHQLHSVTIDVVVTISLLFPSSIVNLVASLCIHCIHQSLLLQVHASLIVVLTRGGSTARLVAKYRPNIPVLTVAVPVLTTDSLTWTCSGEAPARQCLITRGLLPLLAEGSARATDTDTTDEILQVMHMLKCTHACGLCRYTGHMLLTSATRFAYAWHDGCITGVLAELILYLVVAMLNGATGHTVHSTSLSTLLPQLQVCHA